MGYAASGVLMVLALLSIFACYSEVIGDDRLKRKELRMHTTAINAIILILFSIYVVLKQIHEY